MIERFGTFPQQIHEGVNGVAVEEELSLIATECQQHICVCWSFAQVNCQMACGADGCQAVCSLQGTHTRLCLSTSRRGNLRDAPRRGRGPESCYISPDIVRSVGMMRVILCALHPPKDVPRYCRGAATSIFHPRAWRV